MINLAFRINCDPDLGRPYGWTRVSVLTPRKCGRGRSSEGPAVQIVRERYLPFLSGVASGELATH